MATIIKIKRSSATTAPSALAQGELALTYGSGTQGNNGDRLFIGTGTETNGEAANIDVIGGQYFTDMLDHVAGTVTASCAAIVDSNSKVDVLNVDNLTLNGNTVSSTDAAGDINITPHTTGDLVLDGQKWPQAVGSADQFLKTAADGQLSWAAVPSGSFTLAADTGSDDTFTTGNTLTFAGGTGIGTTISDDNLSFAIDATVATLTGTQTLTNKTLTTPTLTTPIANAGVQLKNGASSAGFLEFFEDSDNGTNKVTLIGPASTADVTVTLPAAADTLVGKATTDTFTNKSIDVDNNTVSNIEVDNLKAGVLDTDISAVAGTDTTLASAKAIKTYVDAQLTAADLDVAGDSGTLDIDLDADTFTIAGGTGLTSTADTTTLTLNIDSTVTTLSGAQTLTNKTLTSPKINENVAVAATATELNIMDGGTAASATTLLDADRVVVNDDGTMKQVALTDFETYFEAGLDTLNAVTSASSLATVGTVTTGVWSATDVAVAAGGTGSSTASGARTNLGVAIGSDVQAYDAQLADLSGLAVTNGGFIVGDGSNFVLESANTARTSLGLGTGDTPTFSGAAMGAQKITGVLDPTAAQDAATKAYVDAVKTGLDVKGSCKYATTADLSATYANGTAGVGATLTADANGALTVDGATPSVNDRILVMDQSDAEENGIYTATTVGSANAAFVLTRATDADTGTEFTGGTFTFVEAGTANADNGYVFTHNGAPTMGTTDLTVAQFSGAGQITAGSGMTKSANTMNVVGGTGITANANDIQIAADWTGQNTITTLGTITTGQWQSTDVAVAYGGTGASTFTSNGILYGNAANAIQVTAAGTDGYFLYSNSGTPSWTNQLDGGTF